MLRAVLAATVIAGGAMLGTLSGAQAQSLVPCAREGGFCRVPYPTRVIYGVPGSGIELFVRGGGVPCSNRTFGDPAPGVPKRCSYVARRFDRGNRGWDDGYRGPPRERDRGYRDFDDDYGDFDDGYERPLRRYETY